MIFRRHVSKPEGPVRLSDDSWVITEMNRGIVSHISADGKTKRLVARTGRPNGLALDGDGNLWVAESRSPALLRLTMAGEIYLISKGDAGLPFIWPNDLCFGPDGAIYMTDSGVQLSDLVQVEQPDAVYNMPVDGRVFRIDPVSGACTLLDRGLCFANGIAFGPRGEHLYLAETLTGLIWRYRFRDGGVDADRQVYANVMCQPPESYGRIAGPDGMAFDTAGNLYVAVLSQGDITVLNPSGAVICRLDVPGQFPTNLAFGPPGSRKILVTEGSGDQLIKLEALADGLPLYYPMIPWN